MVRRFLALSTVILIIAACSSSPTASSPGGDGGASAGAEPSVAATAAGGGGGGGGAAEACDLITADEASSVMGMDLTSESTAGTTSYCIYSGADASAVVATTFNASNANDILGACQGCGRSDRRLRHW
jgi:hypothetical protein